MDDSAIRTKLSLIGTILAGLSVIGLFVAIALVGSHTVPGLEGMIGVAICVNGIFVACIIHALSSLCANVRDMTGLLRKLNQDDDLE